MFVIGLMSWSILLSDNDANRTVIRTHPVLRHTVVACADNDSWLSVMTPGPGHAPSPRLWRNRNLGDVRLGEQLRRTQPHHLCLAGIQPQASMWTRHAARRLADIGVAREGQRGAIAFPKMPKNTFLTKQAPNFFMFLPRNLLERLTAVIQGSGVPPPPPLATPLSGGGWI